MNGEMVRNLRLKLKLTQTELGALTGYTRALISKVENGKTANHRTMQRLREVLTKRKTA